MSLEAVVDASGLYRYSLGRSWADTRPSIAFIMLNPSSADHQRHDPTIRRCLALAQNWGYGSLRVVNLFAFRTAQPRLLKQAIAPIGPDNDAYIQAAVDQAETTVLAWGNWGSLHKRDRAVFKLLSAQASKLYCLELNQTGQPRHPLYVPTGTSLKRWQQPITDQKNLA
ncbi:MAG: DUF1643 domain-containing protein [Leptolyngbyaceae cyanobacterium SL_1_1]|nr:DUF1643 domain-containing protein [Leptolyngbyaceae cyanobacterium RM1_1_2]NJO10721.1 DUF1643 domain-containing protein [Leptolyngbyaceae cyanobacterium SL_1_1]